jgi:hypothetical protein
MYSTKEFFFVYYDPDKHVTEYILVISHVFFVIFHLILRYNKF